MVCDEFDGFVDELVVWLCVFDGVIIVYVYVVWIVKNDDC